MSILFAFLLMNNSYAEEDYIEKFSKGEITKDELINLAYDFMAKEKYDKALDILEENTMRDFNEDNTYEKFNLASLYLRKGDVKKGIKTYHGLLGYLKKNPKALEEKRLKEFKVKIRENIYLALNQPSGGGGQGSKDKSDESDQQKGRNQQGGQGDSDQRSKKKKKKSQQVNTEGIIQQIINDDKKIT